MLTFRDSLRRKDFVITAEVPLNPAMTVRQLEAHVDTLKKAVDAVQIGDNEYAEGHMAPLAAATIARGRDVDAVVHLSCRDRNRIALQGEILGALALGISSLVLKRGDKLPSSLKGRIKGVFDTRTAQLFAIASPLTGATDYAANGLWLGTYVTAINPRDTWQAKRVTRKIEAGAGFFLTRPGFDPELIATYAAKLVRMQLTHRASFIAGVPLLTSTREAREFLTRYPKATVAESLLARLAHARDPREEGIDSLAEVLRRLAETPGVTGANILYAEDAATVVEAVRRAGFGER